MEGGAVADASHVGAALLQRSFNGGPWEPLGFFSRKLDKAQVSYSAFDRDLLAAFFAIWHFRFQLEGREFQLLTDHRPLPQALNRFSVPWSLRQQCQLSYIAEYTADIRMYQGWTTLSLTLYPAQPPSSLRQVLCSSHRQLACAHRHLRPSFLQQDLPNSYRRLACCARPPAAVISSAGSSSLQPLAAGRFPHSPPSTSTSCPALLSAVHSSPPILIAWLDMAAMAAGQVSCPEVEALKARPSLRVSMATFGELQLLCDFSTGLPRPLLPPPFPHGGLHRRPLTGPSRNPSHTEANVFKVGVDRHGGRYG